MTKAEKNKLSDNIGELQERINDICGVLSSYTTKKEPYNIDSQYTEIALRLIDEGIRVAENIIAMQKLIGANPEWDIRMLKSFIILKERNLNNIKQQVKQTQMNKEQVAKVAHEMNKAFCESIGDNSQPNWDDAPQWQKDSALLGVQFHLGNPDASPSASHDSWLKQKEQDGWKYGEIKDPEKKEHPCFVSYHQLPVEQRSKDYIFKQVIHSLKPYINE